MTITNQPTPGGRRGRGNNPPPTRLPSSRERRPALAALAVLLIAGGAVLAGWLAPRQSQTEAYLTIDDAVNYGDQIQRSDLRSIDLPADSGNLIPASQRDDVVGSYALVPLVPGTVVADGMYGDAPELETDQDMIGLDLEPSQYPKSIKPGDTVLVVRSDDNGLPVEQTTGTVRDARSSESGGGAVVDVAIASKCSADFASASSFGNVQVVETSPDSTPVTCTDPNVPKTPQESQ